MLLQGQSIVSVQVMALEETPENDIPLDDAVTFFDSLELVLQGVCAGTSSGLSAKVG